MPTAAANFCKRRAFMCYSMMPAEMQMPDDVAAALERFQSFIGRYSAAEVIDQESGFSVSDGMLIVGEVEMSNAHSEPDENPIL